MTDFGTDVSCFDDLDLLREVSGLDLVREDVLWRLQTPRASGILAADAPNYGLDLLSLIGSSTVDNDAAALAGMIRNELTKDERISDVRVDVHRYTEGPSTRCEVLILCYTDEGPFDLVLGVGEDVEGVLSMSVLPRRSS